MSISRRNFIKAASVSAIAVGTIGKPGRVALAHQAEITTTDLLAYYTQATFTQYINSVFRIHGFATVDATLVKVRDTLPLKVARLSGRESFLLHFVGGSVQLPQATYTVEHPALGTFKLFLVPGGDEKGVPSYIATINRLGYTTKPGGSRKPAHRN